MSLIPSFLCTRDEITTRGLSRYCDYSLRQIFRFMLVEHKWPEMQILLFKNFIYTPQSNYIIAVDEVVEDKSGFCGFVALVLIDFIVLASNKLLMVFFWGISLIDIDTKSWL